MDNSIKKKADKFLIRDEFIRGSTLLKDLSLSLKHLTRVHGQEILRRLFPPVSSRMHFPSATVKPLAAGDGFSLNSRIKGTLFVHRFSYKLII